MWSLYYGATFRISSLYICLSVVLLSLCVRLTITVFHGSDGAVAKESAKVLGSHLGTGSKQKRVLNAQRVDVRPLHPILSHYPPTGFQLTNTHIRTCVGN